MPFLGEHFGTLAHGGALFLDELVVWGVQGVHRKGEGGRWRRADRGHVLGAWRRVAHFDNAQPLLVCSDYI